MLKTSAKLSFDSEADTYFPSAPFPHVKMQMMAGTVRPGHGGDHARQRLGPSCGEGAPPSPARPRREPAGEPAGVPQALGWFPPSELTGEACAFLSAVRPQDGLGPPSVVLQPLPPASGTCPPLTTDPCVVPPLQRGADAARPGPGAAVRIHGAFEPQSPSARAGSAGLLQAAVAMPARRSPNDGGVIASCAKTADQLQCLGEREPWTSRSPRSRGLARGTDPEPSEPAPGSGRLGEGPRQCAGPALAGALSVSFPLSAEHS